MGEPLNTLFAKNEMIRKETDKDIQDIRKLNDLVFSGSVEGAIVDAIRNQSPESLSLVAVKNEEIIGHIFFSPVEIAGLDGIQAMGLGPMAVLPEYQKQGIGTALINEGIKQLQQLGCAIVVVLGHAEYYPKFGFSPASGHGLQCQWDGVPDNAFMVRFLRKEFDGVVRGTVKYMNEFNEAV